MRPDGKMLERGDAYRNPDQAESLRAIARNGPTELYTGALAETVAADFERNGAFVTRDDLADYRERWSAPLEGSYRGLRVSTANLPAGGIILLQMLKVLERFELGGLEHNGPEHGFLVSAALAWGGVTRFRYLSDPEHNEVPVDELLSDAHADEIAARIRAGELPDAVALGKPNGTTQLVVVDEEGNCVTLTAHADELQRRRRPGHGLHLERLRRADGPVPGRPNSYVPGRARASALATTIVFRDGEPWLVLGAPGGWSVTSGILQNIVNIVDFGMTPVEAVVAPRFHSEGSPVFCEQRIARRTVQALRDRGVPLQQSLYNYHASFSRPQTVMLTGSGYRAASDPRSDGGAAMPLGRVSRCGRERVPPPARTRRPRSPGSGARSGRGHAAAGAAAAPGSAYEQIADRLRELVAQRGPPPRRETPDRGHPGGRVRRQPCNHARGDPNAGRAGARRGDQGGRGEART